MAFLIRHTILCILVIGMMAYYLDFTQYIISTILVNLLVFNLENGMNKKVKEKVFEVG